jgi:hypothetical protein
VEAWLEPDESDTERLLGLVITLNAGARDNQSRCKACPHTNLHNVVHLNGRTRSHCRPIIGQMSEKFDNRFWACDVSRHDRSVAGRKCGSHFTKYWRLLEFLP